MTLNVVRAGLARLAASLLLILGLALPTAAADRALINMLGYSADGSVFAFEQFGIQDGSGFPYSQIFLVDLVKDQWIGGTPFAVTIDNEEASLADARTQAVDKAKVALEKYRIEVPVEIVALIGEGEYSTDTGMRLHWSTPACCGAGMTQPDAQSLILETRGATSTEDYCKDMSPVGYNLYYQDKSGMRALHMDSDVLPASRGCTLDYRIHSVVQPYGEYYGIDLTPRRVAIIAYYPFGFEGVDRRFLVVPIDK